jgi:lysophospholipase L1-like esterase
VHLFSKTVGASGGYRILLQDIMMAANKNVGWVGAVDGVANGTSPVGMQGFHSAVSGATTSTIRTLVANAAINQAPDVILMWLGTNDLRAATAEATIEAAYNGFLNDIFARWPSVTVCCANIDQNYESGTPPLYNPATFNAFIAGLPAARGAQVKAVDMFTPLAFSSLHNDNLHPNHPEGDWLVAQTWWQTIKTLVG